MRTAQTRTYHIDLIFALEISRHMETIGIWLTALRLSRRSDSLEMAVASQNLNPDVLMMKPAKDWNRCDTADLLRPAKIRSISVQREVRSDFTRDRDLRLRTITGCRRTKFSASSLARDFNRDRATSRSLVRNSTVGVPVSQPDPPVTPD